MTVNEKIFCFRDQFHLSKAYVARYLGMDVDFYARIESGDEEISTNDVLKLGILFGVSTETPLFYARTGRLTIIEDLLRSMDDDYNEEEEDE